MKIATRNTSPEPDHVVADALELYGQKMALQKQRRGMKKELAAIEATERNAEGQLDRAKKLAAKGNREVSVTRAERAYTDWHVYADGCRGQLAQVDKEIATLSGQLEAIDPAPIRAEAEALAKESRLTERHLRKGLLDRPEALEARARLERIEERLKVLQPCVADIESLRRARARREKIKASLPEIEREVERYEAAVSEALSAHYALRKLTDGLGAGGADMSLILMVAAQNAGKTLLANLREEIQ